MAALAFLLARPRERVAAALVLGADGREPETVATAEQLRLTVTKRIRAALMKIRQHHSSLGHHLTTCIKTGHFCRYTPNPEHRMSWMLR